MSLFDDLNNWDREMMIFGRPKHYVLRDGEPVAVGLMDWALEFETADRRIAFTQVGAAEVSTAFLGLDHNFTNVGPAILFETLVRGDSPLCDDMERYATLEEAMLGHEQMVGRVRAATSEDNTR